MKNRPIISIIVPVYNVESYLERCINSILNQTFKNFELILVDDGSTDGCKDICNEYKTKDKRIKVIHKENGGLSSARNAGLDIARGKYIGFVDSDDFINKDMYKTLFNTIQDNNSDMVICDYYKVNEDDINKFRNLKCNCENIKIKNLNNLESIDNLFLTGEKFIFAWNKLYKRDLFSDLRYEQGRIYEDEYLAHRILYKCKKVSVIEVKMYYYVQRKGSLINSPFTVRRFDKVYAIKDRVDFLREKKLTNLEDKAEKTFIDYFVWNYFVAYQRLENIESELKILKKMFNRVFFKSLDNKFISLKEKLTLVILYLSPKLYNKLILNREL